MEQKKKVLCFGNPYIEEDKLALIIGSELRVVGYEFILCKGVEDMLLFEPPFIVMDVVKGIVKVTKFTDVSKLENRMSCSLHDFDLGYNLRLMKKFGMVEKVSIIGVPPEIEEEKAMEGIKKIIQNIDSL